MRLLKLVPNFFTETRNRWFITTCAFVTRVCFYEHVPHLFFQYDSVLVRPESVWFWRMFCHHPDISLVLRDISLILYNLVRPFAHAKAQAYDLLKIDDIQNVIWKTDENMFNISTGKLICTCRFHTHTYLVHFGARCNIFHRKSFVIRVLLVVSVTRTDVI